MASTRNKNTPGNYFLEMQQHTLQNSYRLNSRYGIAHHTQLPGNGLLPSKLPREHLSNNAIDIESYLFGVNSTNLVNLEPILHPSLNRLSVHHMYQPDPIIMPTPLAIEKNRPYCP